jgi:hypothetical protein
LIIVNKFFLILSILIFLLSLFSLFRDEFLFQKKTLSEIFITFPFLVFVEFAHFWGAFMGVMKFRILGRRAGIK